MSVLSKLYIPKKSKNPYKQKKRKQHTYKIRKKSKFYRPKKIRPLKRNNAHKNALCKYGLQPFILNSRTFEEKPRDERTKPFLINKGVEYIKLLKNEKKHSAK